MASPSRNHPDSEPGPGKGSNLSSLGGLLSRIRRANGGRVVQRDLISSLNDVADAVSSAMDVEDVLETIVDRAKRVTNTDKAALVLADEHGDGLDLDSLVVRGKREQHVQDWWEARLLELGPEVFATHDVVIENQSDFDAWLLRSPVRVKDHPIGVLIAINSESRPFTDLDVDFIAILSAFAASAIENARLAEQSRYVLLASERDRIAREMHDGVVQSLFSIALGLEVCKKQVFRDPGQVSNRLDELQAHLNASMTELRRFIYDLRPMSLTELGLVGAIEYWIREVASSEKVKGKLVVEGELPVLRPSEEACLYRVAKEAVSNIVKHAEAEHFEVTLVGEGSSIEMRVYDDGGGFDPEQLSFGGVGEKVGLRSIKERVARANGELLVQSAPGEGTTITVRLRAED